jgi:hypothetical protein
VSYEIAGEVKTVGSSVTVDPLPSEFIPSNILIEKSGFHKREGKKIDPSKILSSI